ncbi:MAG: hypothetical protein LBM01_01560 [Christensenellaceae bacterium]|jgi:hypothetical protein|nr:hypothetical protein [Christensenellaceae bacterium]
MNPEIKEALHKRATGFRDEEKSYPPDVSAIKLFIEYDKEPDESEKYMLWTRKEFLEEFKKILEEETKNEKKRNS